MMGRQSGLGRGLGALIPQRPSVDPMAVPSAAPMAPAPVASLPPVPVTPGLEIQFLATHLIDPNPHQPRRHFDHQEMEDLVSSVKEHGIIQPIIVTAKRDGRFELVAGERRLRAATIAEMPTIPSIIRGATDQEKMELALIENIQRADLNAIEEAHAYERLNHEFGLTQDEISRRVGKSRPQITNIIRLLQLPDVIQQAVIEGKISPTNARTILAVPEGERMQMFETMVAGNFTVHQTEMRVPHPRRKSNPKDANLAEMEIRVRDALGAKVYIKRDIRGEGEIRIAFFSDEDLKALVDKLSGM